MRKFLKGNAMLYFNGMAFLTFMSLYFAIGDTDSDMWNGLYFIFQYMLPLALIQRLLKYECTLILKIIKPMYFALILYTILAYGFKVEQSEELIFLYFIFSLFLLSHENLIKKIWGQ
jgi:hypothetical protein